MRDPIERVVSHYYYHSREQNSSAGYGSANEHLYAVSSTKHLKKKHKENR